VKVVGRAAHAGLEPEAGASAIDELVDRLLELRGLSRPDEGTSINVGVISGGSARTLLGPTSTFAP
jgi:glutamate carboxypeptidase